MDLGIAGDVALVAASSSGLGRASAKALADEGANVVVNGRDQDRLEETAEALRETATGEVYAQAADLTDSAAIEALVETTVSRFGGLDHLVTNAGGPPSEPFSETTLSQWQDGYELLIRSTVQLCLCAEAHLRAGDGGTIVSITSKAVKEPVDGLVLSNALRTSVVGLVKTLAREWAPEVRSNVVLPGTHETDRISDLIDQAIERGEFGSVAEGEEHWGGGIPLGRMGDPVRFGQVVAFLSSAPASHVNGAALVVDGGESHSIL